MRRFVLALVAVGYAATSPAADDGPRFTLSIYSAAANNGDSLFSASGPDTGPPGGYAIVRDRRQFDLKPGRNPVDVRDLSRFLDPAALSVHALGDNAAQILSQRFADEALSLDALVQKHLGHNVEVVVGAANANPTLIAGTLLSNAGGLTVQGADGRVTTIAEFNRITFPDLPKGLAAAPSMHWDVDARKAGAQAFEIVYPTQGLGWRAEYSGWLGGAGECRLSLSGWAQIANRSGTDFPGARVKLIAGEPHHVGTMAPAPRVMARATASGALQAEDSGNAGDYHEYTLDNTVDVATGSMLRAALFAEQALPCRREYVFESSRLRANTGMAPITDRNYGIEAPGPVRSTLAFKAERPLPAGRLRVLQNAADGVAEFAGEDTIAHTPRGENVALQLGNAFDLRGERKQADFQVDKDRRTVTESFAIRLSNGGDAAQAVDVREHLYRWTQWSITQSSIKFTKRNADTVDFVLDVPPNGNASVTYTVQYQWTESFK